MIDLTNNEFALLSRFLYNLSGISVPAEKRYLFKTRLSAFLEQINCRSFSEFYNRLTVSNDQELAQELVQAMTTHESYFFRDIHPFETLRDVVLPAIAEEQAARSVLLKPRIRILSAGCSMGQEAYSIAMCVREWISGQTRFTVDDITIHAVDISQRIIRRARKGVFSDLEIGTHLPDGYREKYLRGGKDQWHVTGDISAMVRFSILNLSESFDHAGKFDIIFCRNVIIYFPLELKVKILDKFSQTLNPGGVLFMGSSESTYNICDKFTSAQNGKSTYYIMRPRPE